MFEVEQQRDTGNLLDFYKEKYQEKYRTDPVIPNMGVANTILKDLVRSTGFSKAKAIIDHYFKTDGDQDWFRRNGHSLNTLSKSVEQINASMGSKTSKHGPVTAIMFHSICPSCQKSFQIVCAPEDCGKHACTTRCEDCQSTT